jgi:uncharacterized protein YndB with AHSA1/START domain
MSAPPVSDALPHRLTRSVQINAERATVFRFFSETALFAKWWGAGSSIDPRPGGALLIRYPNAVVASGTVEGVVPGESIVFTYGYEGARHGLPPGASRVTVLLQDAPGGTTVQLHHDFGDPGLRDLHDGGWRFQLSLFANVAALEQHALAARCVDQWFEAWNATNAQERRTRLEQLVEPGVRFHDRYAAIAGIADLESHIAAAHQHMPGVRLERSGEPRQCQGTVLVEWIGTGSDGRELARGTNYVQFSPRARIAEVIGFSTA